MRAVLSLAKKACWWLPPPCLAFESLLCPWVSSPTSSSLALDSGMPHRLVPPAHGRPGPAPPLLLLPCCEWMNPSHPCTRLGARAPGSLLASGGQASSPALLLTPRPPPLLKGWLQGAGTWHN